MQCIVIEWHVSTAQGVYQLQCLFSALKKIANSENIRNYISKHKSDNRKQVGQVRVGQFQSYEAEPFMHKCTAHGQLGFQYADVFLNIAEILPILIYLCLRIVFSFQPDISQLCLKFKKSYFISLFGKCKSEF